MPFDGQTYKANTVADVLRRAREVIDTPDKLCQHKMDDHGKHCTIGAFNAVGAYPSDELDFFLKANGFNSRAAVMIENDLRIGIDGKRKAHKTIMGWFDKAIQLAESE